MMKSYFNFLTMLLILLTTVSAQSQTINPDTVGIGISPAQARLDVNGSVKFRTAGTAYSLGFTRSGNPQLYGTTEAGLLLGGGISGTNMVILPNGNVGIGMTDPQAKLDVNGGFKFSAASTAYSIGFTRTGNPQLYGTTEAGLLLGGDVTGTAATILPDGNVGIGTESPGYKLHTVTNNNTNNAAAFLWGQYYGTAVGVSTVSPSYYAFAVLANATPLGAGGTGGTKSLLYVRADGNIGIGTFDPGAYKLAVEGTIGARKVKVTQGTWADFVFEPGYNLPSLQKVEKFIKEHQHLPEIPSAREVENEGLDLGEMNKKLLQKIEELTLYLIKQEKLVYRQQSELQELKKRLERVEHQEGF